MILQISNTHMAIERSPRVTGMILSRWLQSLLIVSSPRVTGMIPQCPAESFALIRSPRVTGMILKIDPRFLSY